MVNFFSQSNSDISAYTYERTLMMEQRTEMLKQMRVKQNVKEVCAFTLEILTLELYLEKKTKQIIYSCFSYLITLLHVEKPIFLLL